MRAVVHVALNDLRLHVAERANIFFLFLMPLGFIFLFGLVMGGGGSPSDVRVSLPVVNEDQGFLAQAFIEQLRGESFDVQVYTAAAADSTEFDSRYARIPAGFTEKVLAGEQVTVALTKRADSDVSYDAAAEVQLAQAQARFIGNLVRWAPKRADEEGQNGERPRLADVSEAERGRFLALIADPPTVTVKAEFAGEGRPVPSGMGQSVPGVIVMFVVMTVLIGGTEALTREKQLGTLRRLATSPLSKAHILSGKVLGLTFLGLVQAAILLVTTELLGRLHLFNIDFIWSDHIVGLLLLLIPYTLCIAALGLLMGGLFRTTQQAEGLSWLVGLALSGLGGTWWPLEATPNVMKTVGHLFPTAWAMDGMHQLISFGHGPRSVLEPVAVILAMALLFAALGVRTMRISSA